MANATIRDVAREAEASVASVSRVLNGHENVRPELRLRVEHAAALLGYVPHAGARSLSMSRTGAIGVLLPDLHGEFFSEVLRGMDREASARGLQLLLSNMHADPVRGIEALRSMRGRVDGLVVMAPHVDPDLLFAQMPVSMPAILVNCAPHHQQRPELNVDNAGGAAAMTRHLIDIGRRHIVHIAGPQGNIEAVERCRGYTETMRAVGLEPIIVAGEFEEISGTRMVHDRLREGAPFDAIFAANDMMAIGAMLALRDAGIDVPGQVAIAGFDDVPLARLISPALTTMRVDIASIGARALERVADLIGGAVDTAVEPMMPQLVIRSTTQVER